MISRGNQNFDDENDKQKIKKIVVNGIDVKIINERVQYIDENGNNYRSLQIIQNKPY